jgi:hypothetical protein
MSLAEPLEDATAAASSGGSCAVRHLPLSARSKYLRLIRVFIGDDQLRCRYYGNAILPRSLNGPSVTGKENAMPATFAENFSAELNAIHKELLALDPALAGTPWRVGGWTRKQIVGHLLDSATNNRQRFVRASREESHAGPQYEQQAWVAAHGYADQSWETLLRWWQVEHEILIAVVDRIAADRLDTVYAVGDDEPVTLRFLVDDYIAHQRWHLKQLKTDPPAK